MHESDRPRSNRAISLALSHHRLINPQEPAPAGGFPDSGFMARQPRARQNNLSQPSPSRCGRVDLRVSRVTSNPKEQALHRALAKGLRVRQTNRNSQNEPGMSARINE